jgi:hypothetical protein
VSASLAQAELWSPPGFGPEVLLRPRTCCEPLAPLDLRSLSFLAARLGSGSPPFQAECSLSELGAAVYGRRAGGSDRRALEASLHRLEAAVVTLEGCDLVAGELSPATTRAPLFRAVSVAGAPPRLTYEFSPWLAAAVAHGRFPLLDLELLRALPATAARLWALLEGTSRLAPDRGERGVRSLRCDHHLCDALGLGHAREADARRALRLAAAEVVAADPRYVELAVKRTRAGWVLRAERAHRAAYDGNRCVSH